MRIFAGGADDELTVRANEAVFRRLRLLPRVLRASGTRTLDVTLAGTPASMPVLIAPTAPTAFHRLAHPDGVLLRAGDFCVGFVFPSGRWPTGWSRRSAR